MMLFILATFYATMVASGYIIEFLFGALGLVPATRDAKVVEASITLNYTTVLNTAFLLLAAVLVYRLVRSGGTSMLRMMGGDPEEASAHGSHHHHFDGASSSD
jgi:hypothetical protein